MVEDRGDVRRERFGRGEELGRRVGGSQGTIEVLRDAESRKRGDRWRAPDLRKVCAW